METSLMAQTRRTPYVSMNVTVPARDRLRRTTWRWQAEVDHPLSMSAVLLAMADVVEENPEAMKAALARQSTSEGTDAP